jgi:hypothetical protein
MKIVPFPRRGDEADDALLAELEAALSGESTGAEAESWRELRTDVRGLAPTMPPEFEQRLRERIDQRAVAQRDPKRSRAAVMFSRARAWLRSSPYRPALAGSVICVLAAIVVLVIVIPQDSGVPLVAKHVEAASESGTAASSLSAGVAASGTKHSSEVLGVSAAPAGAVQQGAPSNTRLQQLGASITLAPKPGAVQSVASEVAQLAARDGGFVQSSQVRVEGQAGEANLQLSLPSARLSTALAELGRLAPARSESQSLQDITDEYDTDRTKLADAVAEREALLRALAKASTQGQIESLHARLGLAAAAITRARSDFQAVSKRGSNSSVEVTVLGDAHPGSSESTLSKALHDAGDVLKGALAVAIVALAVLVPLAILLVLLALGWRAMRRRLRERVLSQR